jgi:ribonuclease D
LTWFDYSNILNLQINEYLNMPKAEYTTSDGTKVSLEGNAKEIAELIKLLSSQSSDVKASPKPVANKKLSRIFDRR